MAVDLKKLMQKPFIKVCVGDCRVGAHLRRSYCVASLVSE